MSNPFVEKKWQTNMGKVAFAKAFPGRLVEWESAIGKTIEKVVSFETGQMGMVIFSDGTFIATPSPNPQPADLIRLLFLARPDLIRFWKEAFDQLDQWVAMDREMQKKARLQNIIGAIQNNLPQIPELKEALEEVLKNIPANRSGS
ncbi:MAG: hypothetical protein AAB035_05190 [Nitrospirota bacterium]